jgi:hypothetical protein
LFVGRDQRHGSAAGEALHLRLVPVAGVREHDLRRVRDPRRGKLFSFNDPDGNMWLVQEVTTRLPGRVDAAAAAGTT